MSWIDKLPERINEEEVEVFRLNPGIGRCYKWAEYTRMTPETSHDPARYYAHKVVEVGKLVQDTLDESNSIGGIVWGRPVLVFRKSNGQEMRVEKTSKTCFIECPPASATPSRASRSVAKSRSAAKSHSAAKSRASRSAAKSRASRSAAKSRSTTRNQNK